MSSCSGSRIFHELRLSFIRRQNKNCIKFKDRTVSSPGCRIISKQGQPNRSCPYLYLYQDQQSRSFCSNSSTTDHFNKDQNSGKEYDDETEITPQKYDFLYPGHISTSPFQKCLLALGSGITSLMNPARDDMICALGETTGPPALRYMLRKMKGDPVGSKILEEKPLINTETVDISYLGSLPEGTFGKEYWHFLEENGFSPDARRPVNFIDDPELMYVMLRYRQCHDLTHTLLGMPPNLLGEVAVKWFEAVQTGLPMCVTAAMFGPIRLGPKHRQKYISIYLPWAIRSGYNAKILANVYFEKHWETDMEDLRRQLNVEPAPVPLKQTKKNRID